MSTYAGKVRVWLREMPLLWIAFMGGVFVLAVNFVLAFFSSDPDYATGLKIYQFVQTNPTTPRRSSRAITPNLEAGTQLSRGWLPRRGVAPCSPSTAPGLPVSLGFPIRSPRNACDRRSVVVVRRQSDLPVESRSLSGGGLSLSSVHYKNSYLKTDIHVLTNGGACAFADVAGAWAQRSKPAPAV